MKKLALLFCLVFIIPTLLKGQEPESRSLGRGYAFAAPGAATTFNCRSCTYGTLHFGGGGEATFYKGLGIGAELGYLVPTEDMSSGMGLLSLNGVYIFRSKGKDRLEPFVTAGGSLLFASGGSAGGINFGGGLQYWLKKRLGLRIEFRDHMPTEDTNSHLFEARIGIAFR